MTRQSIPRYHEAYRKLTNDLINMYATERTALDESAYYTTIMEHVLAGRYDEAVVLSLQFRSARGDEWRARAAEHGLYSTDNYVLAVGV
jgi:hypothetical protein